MESLDGCIIAPRDPERGRDALPRVRADRQVGPTKVRGRSRAPGRCSALRLHKFTRRNHLRFVAFLAFAFSLAALLSGCVTKSKAEAQARMAYLAGQRQAALQWQQTSPGSGVIFVGPVHQPLVTWSEGLMLSQAIVNAGYYAAADPRRIILRREGQEIQVDPKRLLQGEDVPLQPGDIIELEP